ncbi:hypothetical protein ACFWUQ_04185 [Streptomyces sp. NPDC058662]|uniref:8-oxoguanine DNA glycosylase OGG fold protein n=1 Tax=Streptomyces sp. NPDC058662 TaxID=3346583 RepID=UPI0036628080
MMIAFNGRGSTVGRQDDADALDATLMEQLLPPSAVRALSAWLSGTGAPYAAGAGSQAVPYVPGRWSGIEPWPDQFPERSHADVVTVDRAQVVEAVREAAARGEWARALVASYVWGQGRTGYGPHRLRAVLAEPNLSDVLARAGTALRSEGAVEAYRLLSGAVRGWGPAFFTKYLYFLSVATDAPGTPRALILDQRVARVLRARATRVGLDAEVASAPDTAAWTWSDAGWTAHRYGVYLRWMDAAAGQLARSGAGWPAARPDLLELALFSGAWNPAE